MGWFANGAQWSASGLGGEETSAWLWHPLLMAAVHCAQDFYNEKAYWECASRHIPAPFNPAVDIWNDGWQTTIDLIKMQASNMSS